MGKRRHSTHQLHRRKPYREPRKRFLVVCGGSVTEPSYFEGVKQKVRDRLIKLDVVAGTRAPGDIVTKAIRLNNEANARADDDFDRFDAVWCVFDKDQFDIRPAMQAARANGVSTAISNPCFELWLLLHFQEQEANISATQARRLCQRYLRDYDKRVDIDHIWELLRFAMERAEALDALHSRNGNPGANPSTNVHELMSQIEQSQLRIHSRH